MVYVLLGSGLLWFGWFGFNAGSALGITHLTSLAFTNTLLAPAATLVVWMAIEARLNGRPTAIGAATAIVVGCIGITPAAGFVSPPAAMLLGAIAALPSYGVIQWRPRTRLDESLGMDVLQHGEEAYNTGEGAILLREEVTAPSDQAPSPSSYQSRDRYVAAG